MGMDKDTFDAVTAAAKAAQPIIELPDGVKGVVIPEDYSLHVIEKNFQLPPYVEASPTFSDASSFLNYWNRSKGINSVIFADFDNALVTAIFDYPEAASETSPNGKANFGRHVALLSLKFSPYFTAWRDANNQAKSQKAFAEFLEDNRLTVVSPDGATLLELVSNLSMNNNVEFTSNVKLQDGSSRLVFSQDATLKGGKNQIDLPATVGLAVPIYQGGMDADVAYPISAFLRSKIVDKNAFFTVKLDNLDKVVRTAFTDIVKVIGEKTGVTILNGTPSASVGVGSAQNRTRRY